MCRALTFAALRRNVDPADAEPVAALASRVELTVGLDGVLVDGVVATIEIRGPEVTREVTTVAANPALRSAMLPGQGDWARRRGGGEPRGRQLGSAVFPDLTPQVQ